jgi:hypothetical protein
MVMFEVGKTSWAVSGAGSTARLLMSRGTAVGAGSDPAPGESAPWRSSFMIRYEPSPHTVSRTSTPSAASATCQRRACGPSLSLMDTPRAELDVPCPGMETLRAGAAGVAGAGGLIGTLGRAGAGRVSGAGAGRVNAAGSLARAGRSSGAGGAGIAVTAGLTGTAAPERVVNKTVESL